MNVGKVIALIFAGGTGSRMSGAKTPKQFLSLGGKEIIAHTIDRFESHPLIDGVVVVCLSEGMSRFREIIAHNQYKKVLSVVPGGVSGQESIFFGLQEIDRLGYSGAGSIVLVHDGVRPLVDEGAITGCIESVESHGCTAVVAPAAETIVTVDDEGKVSKVIDREKCRLARAPQGFWFDELFAAHRKARDAGSTFIDSISLMSSLGYPIYAVDGPVENVKITTPRDFFSFKGFVDMKEIGQLWQA